MIDCGDPSYFRQLQQWTDRLSLYFDSTVEPFNTSMLTIEVGDHQHAEPTSPAVGSSEIAEGGRNDSSRSKEDEGVQDVGVTGPTFKTMKKLKRLNIATSRGDHVMKRWAIDPPGDREPKRFEGQEFEQARDGADGARHGC